MERNLAQEKVINAVDGQYCCIACPGAGKTYSLVKRIDHMINVAKIPSEQIIMLTFTNASAKEMKERYISQYGETNTTFCTIHSLCLAILRKFANINNESIITDAFSLLLDKLKYERRINDKVEFVKGFITEVSVIKNNSLDINTYKPKCCEDSKLFRELFEAYEKHKDDFHLIDFDDMLIKSYDLMLNNKAVLEWLKNKYRYIQVDECQDLNCLQRDIIYLLAGKNGNLMMVGDDDQAIYGFRGSKPEIMLNFKKDYPNAEMIYMSTNYRSYKKIIENSDKLIKNNKNRFSKDFLCSKSEDGNVSIIGYPNRTSQLNDITQRIKKSDTPDSEVAVLYRTNYQAEELAMILIKNNIKYHSTEKINSKYKSWMFNDLVSYYKLANGKGSKQDLALVLNHPQRFLFNPKYFKCGLNKKQMIEVARSSTDPKWKVDKAVSEIMDFFFLLDMLKGKKPTDFLNTLYNIGLYKKYLKEYAEYRNATPEEYKDLWDMYYDDAKKNDSWDAWNHYIVKYNIAINNMNKSKEGIALSTMHCSKGLEWKDVYIIDAVKGVCPFAKAESIDDLEEERRLFYVAMTRAKENLLITYYTNERHQSVSKSPYIFEISSKNEKTP